MSVHIYVARLHSILKFKFICTLLHFQVMLSVHFIMDSTSFRLLLLGWPLPLSSQTTPTAEILMQILCWEYLYVMAAASLHRLSVMTPTTITPELLHAMAAPSTMPIEMVFRV